MIKLTKEQQTEIDNMEISERVELIRNIFWNDQKFNENYSEVIGQEDYETSPENSEYFLKGATSMFDVALMMSVNHWHGDKDIDEQCQLENDYLMRVMETAFAEINPAKMATWKKLREQK